MNVFILVVKEFNFDVSQYELCRRVFFCHLFCFNFRFNIQKTSDHSQILFSPAPCSK